MHDHREAPQGPTYSKSSLATVSCKCPFNRHKNHAGGILRMGYGDFRKSQDSIKGRKKNGGGW